MSKLLKGSAYYGNHKLSFHIDLYTIQPNEFIDEHTHDFVEMAYVYEGSARHHIGGHTYTLRAGDLFVIEPGTAHSYTGSREESTLICNLLFDRHLLYREISTMEPDFPMLEFLFLLPFLRKSAMFIPHMFITGKQRLMLEKHLETLLHEMQLKEPGYPLMVKSRMIECMITLSRFCSVTASEVKSRLDDGQWMEFAAHFIKQNYNKALTLEQISRMCGMSVPSFSAKFKAFTGHTFLSCKHEEQMRQACRLLLDTSLKVTAIGHEVGFEDIGFFYRLFRKRTGMSPVQYRNHPRSPE